MFLRALRICSPDFIDQEIKFIYSIARDYQYPEHLIDDAYHRNIKSHHNRNVSRDPIQNILTLPFHRPFLLLVNIFKHHFNITIVFHYNNTISKGKVLRIKEINLSLDEKVKDLRNGVT